MAETETGWTKEYPSLKYGSWFFLRHSPDAEPELHQLTGGRKWMESFGIVRDSTEFLGPVTAADFEQLTRLREAVEAARAWICRVSNQYILGTDDPHEVLVKLRQALEPELAHRHTGGEKP